MLEKNKGIDIVTKIGGITTAEAAADIFTKKMEKESIAKIKEVKNPEIILRIANAIAITIVSQ